MDGGMSAWLPSFLAPVCISSRRDEGEGEEAGEVTDALAAGWWGAAAAPDACRRIQYICNLCGSPRGISRLDVAGGTTFE